MCDAQPRQAQIDHGHEPMATGGSLFSLRENHAIPMRLIQVLTIWGVFLISLSQCRPHDLVPIRAVGTVAEIQDFDDQFSLDGSVVSGSRFEFEISLDLDAQPFLSFPELYFMPSASATVGGYRAESDAADQAYVAVVPDPSLHAFHAGLSRGTLMGNVVRDADGAIIPAEGLSGSAALILEDPSATVLSSTALIVPNLGDWEGRGFVFEVGRAGGLIFVRGQLTELTVVPEPSIMGLLCLGGIGMIVVWRGRSLLNERISGRNGQRDKEHAA